jgi:hypothetical protein
MQFIDLFCKFRKSRRIVAAVEDYIVRPYPIIHTFPVTEVVVLVDKTLPHFHIVTIYYLACSSPQYC